MSVLLAVAAGTMMVFGIVLFVVSLAAFARLRGLRVLMVALAFFILFVKGCLLAFAAFDMLENAVVWSAMADLVVLLLLAVSVLKP